MGDKVVKLTPELLERYKHHPRILEVRFVLLFDLFEREYGYNGVMDIYKGICVGFNRNKELLDTLLNKRFDIKRKSKSNRKRWRQEVIFMGVCYGESMNKIASQFLCSASSNLYTNKQDNDPHYYVTEDWLRQLDDDVKVACSSIYKNEIKGFLDVISGLTNVLCKWEGVRQ